MYKCKFFTNGNEKALEVVLNEFLSKLEDGKLIDIKYQFQVVEKSILQTLIVF